MNIELKTFVRDALLKEIPRKQIQSQLTKAGWPKDEIKSAMDAYADVEFAVPVPLRKPYLSAREAFLHLVMFMALYISAIGLGTLLFQFINIWLPDPIQQYYMIDGIRQSLRMGTSSLIIAFPIFLWMTMLVRGAMKKDPEKRDSKIRRWLTYITLFVAAGIIIGDLIGLLNSLLGGELTLRFFLKALIVGGISSSIFGYYLTDLRSVEKE
ncbi:MAG: DUF5671 domain-containing protein [bacterium]|nr:DUF5671 domain-containing protein [bacterium]